MSKDQRHAERETEVHADANQDQDEEDDRMKLLLERLKALEVTPPVPRLSPPPSPPFTQNQRQQKYGVVSCDFSFSFQKLIISALACCGCVV